MKTVRILDQSKSNTPSYQILSIQSADNMKELAGKPITFVQMQQNKPGKTQYHKKKSNLVSRYVTIFSAFSAQIIQIRKHIMKYIQIQNYHWPRIFILFNVNCAILRKGAKYMVPFFNCLQLKAKCLVFTVKFSVIKIFVPPTSCCFFKSVLSDCFLLSSAFFQYFLLITLIMVFSEPLLDLPILWQSPTSLHSILTSISERTDVTLY